MWSTLVVMLLLISVVGLSWSAPSLPELGSAGSPKLPDGEYRYATTSEPVAHNSMSSASSFQPKDVHCWTQASPKCHHIDRSRATRNQRIPSTFTRSSVYLKRGFKKLRLPVRGRHSKTYRPMSWFIAKF